MASTSNYPAPLCPKCGNCSFELKEITENSKTILVKCCDECGYEAGRQENYIPCETDDILKIHEKFLG